MILGVSELLRLVAEQNLVENLSERELTNPEGAGFDLRIGEVYEVDGEGYLGITERETPKMKLVAKYDANKSHVFKVKHNIYYIVKTIENVNMPLDMVALFRPRSTLFRSGVTLFTGATPPGYKGELNFGMINMRQENFNIELGSRFVHVNFYKVIGGTNPYRGQWQGGRTTTVSREVQV